MKFTTNRITILFFLLSISCWGPFSMYSQEKQAYLFSYFTGNGEDGLHLAYSRDGYVWKALNDGASLLTPKVGENKLMRDPCITQGPDGTFHMVWTTSWTGETLGHATSKDLIRWTDQQAIPVMAHESGVKNTWAPEINYNPEKEEYIIYWASTISGKFPETLMTDEEGEEKGNHRMYYTTTKDFKEFTPTRLFFEPGFSVIDATVISDGEGSYVMFVKDETDLPVAKKHLLLTRSASITGPWEELGDPVTGDYWAEGPTAVRIGNKWHLYFDKYMQKEYGLLTSPDLENWIDEGEKLQMPEGIRHGTVFKVEEEILQKLLDNDEN